ncbi:hypothetical protein COO60DRAFT_536814 [Scenedesmus sp. NREL 46B-D3]|nr:hypothetical protein COO60DRAFT_536814 [Scenedesmus sp. NREL 46B-D3]
MTGSLGKEQNKSKPKPHCRWMPLMDISQRRPKPLLRQLATSSLPSAKFASHGNVNTQPTQQWLRTSLGSSCLQALPQGPQSFTYSTLHAAPRGVEPPIRCQPAVHYKSSRLVRFLGRPVLFWPRCPAATSASPVSLARYSEPEPSALPVTSSASLLPCSARPSAALSGSSSLPAAACCCAAAPPAPAAAAGLVPCCCQPASSMVATSASGCFSALLIASAAAAAATAAPLPAPSLLTAHLLLLSPRLPPLALALCCCTLPLFLLGRLRGLPATSAASASAAAGAASRDSSAFACSCAISCCCFSV